MFSCEISTKPRRLLPFHSSLQEVEHLHQTCDSRSDNMTDVSISEMQIRVEVPLCRGIFVEPILRSRMEEDVHIIRGKLTV